MPTLRPQKWIVHVNRESWTLNCSSISKPAQFLRQCGFQQYHRPIPALPQSSAINYRAQFCIFSSARNIHSYVILYIWLLAVMVQPTARVYACSRPDNWEYSETRWGVPPTREPQLATIWSDVWGVSCRWAVVEEVIIYPLHFQRREKERRRKRERERERGEKRSERERREHEKQTLLQKQPECWRH